ncbi:MAG: hypothetical protein GY810_18510 [Aureispira sp.]|nr:hypothetical protein [Aureispira sp.]
MRAFQLLCFLLLLIPCSVWSQGGLPQNAGARGAAMGNASATFTDINSAFSNQAGLGFLEHMSFTAYGERRFLADGLNSFLFAGAYPHKKFGTFGLSVNYFGFQGYNEQKVGLAYARKLFKRMSLGVQVDYLGTRIAEYGSAHAVTFELGVLVKITDQFSLGAHTYSPIRIKLPNQDFIPGNIKIGAAYQPGESVVLTAELEKGLDNHPFIGRFGVEYWPVHAFAIRAGVSTDPVLASFGMGVRFKGLYIDVAANYHMVLGFTPTMSLSYVVGEKSKAEPKD